MNFTAEKRFLSLFLAFVMVISLFPWWTIDVFAADSTSVTQNDITISISSSSNVQDVSASNGVVTVKAKAKTDSCGGYKSVTATLTIKNTSIVHQF